MATLDAMNVIVKPSIATLYSCFIYWLERNDCVRMYNIIIDGSSCKSLAGSEGLALFIEVCAANCLPLKVLSCLIITGSSKFFCDQNTYVHASVQA